MAASSDGASTARKKAERLGLTFPVVSDERGRLMDALGLRHRKAGPDLSDVFYATLFLVDEHGTVKWKHATDNVGARATPDEILAAARAAR